MTTALPFDAPNDFGDLTSTLDSLLDPVVRRLDERAHAIPGHARQRHRRWRLRAAVVTAMLSVLGAGTAVAGFGTSIRLGGLEINLGKRSDSLPAIVTIPNGSTQWPGEPVTEAEAKRRYKARIRLPRAISAPRVIYWMTPPSTGTVTAVWSPSPSLPATSDPNVGLLFSQFIGSADIGPVIMKKTATSRTMVEAVKIGKREGRWISGAPHSIEIVDDSGMRVETPRLVGNTLVWVDGKYTYRLEGNLSKDVALRLARSVR